MLFNSLQFFIFFPIVCLIILFSTYVVKKNIINQIILLAASLYFYMCWKPVYLLLILMSIFITYMSGLYMENKSDKIKKIILSVALISNLGILFFFKYAGFIVRTIDNLLHINQPNNFFDSILLPVGISFYTFQALGYSIDVYRGTIKAERNFITYALFVTFFPQLVAGPIERSKNLLPQFKVNHEFDYNRVTDGLKLAAWGMFKKVVIADKLALYVNTIYNDINAHGSIAIALATFFFTFQILCDFSGYTDIAIGTAQVLGFKLMSNFRQPYFAKNIVDFWRRWHISLSSWFKDYVYIPLGGNRAGKLRHYFNILLTFLISGLWHGAGWNFVFWGFLHGTAQVTAISTGELRKNICSRLGVNEESSLHTIWQIFWTFIFVYITWIFFRVHSIYDGFKVLCKILYVPFEIVDIFKSIIGNGAAIFGTGFLQNITLGMSKYDFCAPFFLIFVLLLNDVIGRKKSMLIRVKTMPLIVRWLGYYVLVLSILFAFLSNISTNSQFIYFQF